MKRRWFQIHLSTAIVIGLIGAALLLANLQLRNEPLEWRGNEIYGFPSALVLNWTGDGLIRKDKWIRLYRNWMLSRDGIIWNAFSWAAILFVPTLICEWFARRRGPQIHLSTLIVAMILLSCLMLIFLGAWKEVTKSNYLTRRDGSYDKIKIAEGRKEIADEVLLYGPPAGVLVVVGTIVFMEKRICRREARKP